MNAQRLAGWLIVALCIAACAAAMTVHFEIGLNNDNLVLLYQTQLWLQGRELYVSLVAPSLPMIFVLYAPPVGASLATGVPVTLSFDLWTTCLLALSLALCHRVLLRRPPADDRLARWLILSLIAVGLVILPLRDNVFGDRDHLVVLLVSPYLLRLAPPCASASLGRGSELLIGLCAAIGLGIKPYVLAIWGMQQAYWISRERSVWRVPGRFATAVVAGAYAAYLLSILLATPEYRLVIAPMAWEAYGAISPPISHRVETIGRIWTTILGLPVVCGVILVLTRPRSAHWNLVYLLLLTVGASVAAFAGGWHYAYYPTYVLALAFTAAVIAALLALLREPWPRRKAFAGSLLLVAALLCVTPVYLQLLRPALARGAVDLEVQRKTGWPWGHQRFSPDVEHFFARHFGSVENPRFLLLGAGTWDSNLVGLDPSRTSVSRFYSLWPLPAVVAARGEPERARRTAWIKEYLQRSVTEDLRDNQPERVFVERSVAVWGLPASFDVLGFFLRYPPFAEAWHGYTLVERIDRCPGVLAHCAYDVFYRNDLVGRAP